MRKLLSLLVTVIFVLLALPAQAATRQPVSQEYIDKYFTSVAAAACLGAYLPESATEFDYLRSRGWRVLPERVKDDKVEADFVIAHNYFPELRKRIFLVTFRGSKNKKDWSLNLKTNRVNYGGRTLGEMQSLASAPLRKDSPAVHAGFNSYVEAILRSSVINSKSELCGVFKAVNERNDALLVLAGHSLGGAGATLLGERLLDLGLSPDKLYVVTFGAPAIGNEPFAQQYGSRLRLLRVTNTSDPVPGSLQTFFGGYKQFGQQIKYTLSTKIKSIQHDMSMYFDSSISDYYNEYDRQVTLGRIYPPPDRRLTIGKPMVALWINEAEHLKNMAMITDIKRFIIDEYKKALPSYIIMDKALPKDAYTHTDIMEKSRLSGADYIVLLGIDGHRQQTADGWYLTLEQAIFDEQGRMLSMSNSGRKVTPAVGNIQAAGENLLAALNELHTQLPFVPTEFEPRLEQR
jgi:hypothetical protein